MLKRIHHTEITVKDLDKAMAFYTEKLGLKFVNKIYQKTKSDSPGLKDAEMEIVFLQVPGDNSILELIEYKNREGEQCEAVPWNIGQMHVAFEVSDLRKIYEDLKDEEGVEFLSPPIPYKTEEIDALWTYLKDPNGALLELLEMR